ncbi:MAG: hypothetical protein ACK49M_07615 [Actinomycetes bacterium]
MRATHEPRLSLGRIAKRNGDARTLVTVTTFAHVAMALSSTGMA